MFNHARRQTAGLLIALTTIAASSLAQSIDEASYEVLATLDSIEIRHYPARIQALVPLPDSQHSTRGFRALGTFGLAGKELGQEMAITAPVQQVLYVQQPEMAFTMPAAYTLVTLAAPAEANSRRHQVAATPVAVVNCAGWASSGGIRRYSDQFQSALANKGIAVASGLMLDVTAPTTPAHANTWVW